MVFEKLHSLLSFHSNKILPNYVLNIYYLVTGVQSSALHNRRFEGVARVEGCGMKVRVSLGLNLGFSFTMVVSTMKNTVLKDC